MEKISLKHIKELKGSGEQVTLINVLPKQCFKEERIPGSINIPLDDSLDFVQQVESIVPSKLHKIVVYSDSLQCPASTQAAKCLDEAGFMNIMDFKGGIREWKEGGEVLENKKPKKLRKVA